MRFASRRWRRDEATEAADAAAARMSAIHAMVFMMLSPLLCASWTLTMAARVVRSWRWFCVSTR